MDDATKAKARRVLTPAGDYGTIVGVDRTHREVAIKLDETGEVEYWHPNYIMGEL